MLSARTEESWNDENKRIMGWREQKDHGILLLSIRCERSIDKVDFQYPKLQSETQSEINSNELPVSIPFPLISCTTVAQDDTCETLRK